MLRPRRCHLTALLWLALALLPLRGWAQAVMAAQAAPAVAASTAPCHGQVGAADAAPEVAPASHAGCHLCDLCHNALAAPQQAPATPGNAPGSTPGAAPTPALAMAEAGGIFRPPRP